MSAVAVERQPWSWQRWTFVVLGILAVQLALIFRLSDSTPEPSRSPSVAPTLHLAAGGPGELLGLNDPTLFVLPHRQGFSGGVWLRTPSLELPSGEWTETGADPIIRNALLSTLPAQQLGRDFSRFTRTNRFASAPSATQYLPEMTRETATRPTRAARRSTLRVEGELANRRLLSAMSLPSWPHNDVLTNSVVQLLVDAQGLVSSVVLLPPGSGLKDADQHALDLARSALFEPVEPNAGASLTAATGELTWGALVFEWHAVPVPATNPPPITP